MDNDIFDTTAADGAFSTLVAVIETAGFVDILRGPGPFTVFAPTDAAFAALPEGTVEDLLKPDAKDRLTKVLTYHLLPGRMIFTDLDGKTMSPGTYEGDRLHIDGTDGSVKINTATIVTADIECSNGVIHIIDAVLLPA